jgi:Ca-activated chloride channel family protein
VIDLAGFRFQEPLWLWALAVAPLVVAAAWLRERSGASAVAFPGLSRARVADSGWRVRLRRLPVLLAALGLASGVLAQARPQHGTSKQDVTTQGVDIVVALDVSGSMAAEDFQPRNRLEVAKEVVASFVKRRVSDRIGLVVFAGKSLTKAPPTTDTAVLLRQLDDVRLEMLPDGTAIGSGLATSLTRLRHSKARSRLIVLVTDGANNAGEIDPATATSLAKALEVRVYAILAGRGGEVPMPVQVRDPVTGEVLKKTVPVQVDVDPELLRRIAQETGGEFFHATDPDALHQIFGRIDRLERSEIKLTAYRRYRELYRPFLLAAAGLLAAAAGAWATGLRVVPA